MTSMTPDSVRISDDEIVVDAELLADCLALTEASLRDAMSAGRVLTLVEKGEGEDQGRMRLTFRYNDSQFSIMREPDGRLHKTVSPPPERRAVRPSIMKLAESG